MPMRVDAVARVIEWQANAVVGRTCVQCQATAILWYAGDLRVTPTIHAAPRVLFSIVCPTCKHALWFDAAEEGVVIPPGALGASTDR